MTNTGLDRRPHSRGCVVDYDAASQASSAYVGKHSKGKKERQMSAGARKVKLGNNFLTQGNMSMSSNSKTYYPNEYFKRVGYQMSDAGSRVDALGQRVRDRFNEELEMEQEKAQAGGLHSRTLKQLKQANNMKQGLNSAAGSRKSQSNIWSGTRQSVTKATMKTKGDLKYATLDKEALDQESVITKDRLQKFNEIQGAAAQVMHTHEDLQHDQLEEAGDDLERADEVADLPDAEALEEEKDDVKSLAAKSVVSKMSRKSNASSKTYITKLENQLEHEK